MSFGSISFSPRSPGSSDGSSRGHLAEVNTYDEYLDRGGALNILALSSPFWNEFRNASRRADTRWVRPGEPMGEEGRIPSASVAVKAPNVLKELTADQSSSIPTDLALEADRPPVSIRKIITILSGVGFVGGVGGAFLYAMRKGRIEALREGLSTSASSAKGGDATVAALQTQNAAPLPKGLYRSSASAPPAKPSLAIQGKRVKESIFDGDSAAPPSVLRRARPAAVDSTHSASSKTVGATAQENSSPEEDEANPPLIAMKAFGIATALVGAVTFLSVEIGRRLLQIKDLDDLIVKLQRVAPENRSTSGYAWGQGVSHDEPAQESHASTEPLAVDTDAVQPEEVDQVLDALGKAESVEQWFSILKRSLDTERLAEVRARQARMSARERREQELSLQKEAMRDV